MRGKTLAVLLVSFALLPGDALARGTEHPHDGLVGTSRATSTPQLVGRCLLFDDLPAGSQLTVYKGVAFLNAGGPLTVRADIPGPPFTAPNSILPDANGTPGNRTVARPAVSVRGAGITMGDYDSDQETIYLEAYNSSGGLIASASAVLPDTLNGGKSISVKSTAADIASIAFYAVDESGANSVYFDNVCFAR